MLNENAIMKQANKLVDYAFDKSPLEEKWMKEAAKLHRQDLRNKSREKKYGDGSVSMEMPCFDFDSKDYI